MPSLTAIAHSLFSPGTMPDIDVSSGLNENADEVISIYSSNTFSSLPTESGMMRIESGDKYQTTYGKIEHSYEQECKRQFDNLMLFSSHIKFYRGYWEDGKVSVPWPIEEEYIFREENEEVSLEIREFLDWDQLAIKLETTLKNYNLPLSFIGAPNLQRDIWVLELLKYINYVLEKPDRFLLIHFGFMDVIRLVYSQYKYTGNINASSPIIECKFGLNMNELKGKSNKLEDNIEKYILSNPRFAEGVNHEDLLQIANKLEQTFGGAIVNCVVSLLIAVNFNSKNRIIAVAFEELKEKVYQLELLNGTTQDLPFRPWLAPYSI